MFFQFNKTQDDTKNTLHVLCYACFCKCSYNMIHSCDKLDCFSFVSIYLYVWYCVFQMIIIFVSFNTCKFYSTTSSCVHMNVITLSKGIFICSLKTITQIDLKTHKNKQSNHFKNHN